MISNVRTIAKVIYRINHCALVAIFFGIRLSVGKCFESAYCAAKSTSTHCVEMCGGVKAKLLMLVCKGHWFFLYSSVALFHKLAASKFMKQGRKIHA